MNISNISHNWYQQPIQSVFWKIFFHWPHTAWKVSIYGIFYGPYFLAFGLNMYSVGMREKTNQKKTLYLGTFHAVITKLLWCDLYFAHLFSNCSHLRLIFQFCPGNFLAEISDFSEGINTVPHIDLDVLCFTVITDFSFFL